ncbi:hypothetical protein SADUNF_Sadunf19G0056700 [Salix dunnii]|uniref:Uncharacterized protein n=1 Tax=Salix dunnii TaxID=1413687 RepID=A0A835MF80_9ROSI|nr:hypothetical protein SADUNF_Sadunf19G0056300 [Salix dunnii]KAF9661326.1 hypothetical protein SADUNF_Sadunf19G0056500 [Salix dunnii]KAF9661328.1 hypothetical protein SADUNF_Sadunf19G0056700 [Salix dunnii]
MMHSHEFVVPTIVALVNTTLIAKILPPHFTVNDKKFKKCNGFNFKRWKHKILFMFHSWNIISEVQEFQLTLHDTFHGMHNIK